MTDRYSDAAVSLAIELEQLLRALRSPLLSDFMQAWPRAGATTTSPHPPISVPVVRWLAELQGEVASVGRRFVAQLAAATGELAWQRSYGASVAGTAFMDSYGYCELVGSSAGLAAGVLLLAPHTDYPAHWHEAEELYVPLAGAARWWQGVQPWRIRPPGEVIHHARYESHAMRTAGAPLLALYLWRSEHLGQRSRLVSAVHGQQNDAVR